MNHPQSARFDVVIASHTAVPTTEKANSGEIATNTEIVVGHGCICIQATIEY